MFKTDSFLKITEQAFVIFKASYKYYSLNVVTCKYGIGFAPSQ